MQHPHRSTLLTTLAATLLATSGAFAADIPPLGEPTVRFAYLIPSNRSPQPDATVHLRELIPLLHLWCCDQNDRNGQGPRSFRYETEADGVTPLIHVVDVAETDSYLREDVWTRVNQAAGDAGVPVWTPGEVWLLVPEMHEQQPDGSIIGGVALGGSFGSGDDPGVAMIGSTKLSIASLAGLADDTPYDGLTVPGIGPYPLVQDVSFPWFERTTISSVVSSFTGALMHELGHALGRAHDSRNDANFHGNLMFNGLRGMRGALLPELYPDDHARLAFACSLAWSVSPYFEPCGGERSAARAPLPRTRSAPSPPPRLARDDLPGADDVARPMPTRGDGRAREGDVTPPSLSVLTSGTVDPIDGRLVVAFEASDAGGLAAAFLRREGGVMDELELSGTDVQATLSSTWHIPDETFTWWVVVLDLSGNRANASVEITVPGGFNHGPRPFVKIAPPQAGTGETIALDASSTGDPDDPTSALLFEWDVDGDGAFDGPPTPDPVHVTSFDTPGTARVRVRVTDPAGAAIISAPVGLRVTDPCPADIDGDGTVGVDDLLAVLAAWGPCPGCPADVVPDGVVDVTDLLAVLAEWGACG